MKSIETNVLLKHTLKLVFCWLMFGYACTPAKRLTEEALYFRELSDSTLKHASEAFDPVLQKGDILYIGVMTPNEESMKKFNQPNLYAGAATGMAMGGQSSNTLGYLIDNSGDIIFPEFGKLHVEGMTKSVLTAFLTEKLASEIQSPMVSIRFLNFRITVLGEVSKPGTFSIPNERATILDALGLAGDLTLYGKRSNLRIIREKNGVRETGILDLNKGDIFSSPYYYLQQNDVVYVEMNSRKIMNTDNAAIRNVGLIVTILTGVSIIVSLLR